MPGSLRKACHACTAAKRRCRPQLPKCDRCMKNGLTCVYDLEPLANGGPEPEQGQPSVTHRCEAETIRDGIPYLYHNSVSSARDAAIQIFEGSTRYTTVPELRMIPDQKTLQWVVIQLLRIPDLVVENPPTPFVHTALYLGRREDLERQGHALKLHEAFQKGRIRDQTEQLSPPQNVHFQELIKTDIKTLPLIDALLRTNELFLYLIIYFFEKVPWSYQAEAEKSLNLLFDWTTHVWSTLPSDMNSTFSQWQAWLLAESARRGIIASYFVRSAFSCLKYGYAVFQPFLESLPFDCREGVWEATSEDEWQKAVKQHGGQATVLSSYREFIEGSNDIPRALQREGFFQRLLLVSFHSGKALDLLREAEG